MKQFKFCTHNTYILRTGSCFRSVSFVLFRFRSVSFGFSFTGYISRQQQPFIIHNFNTFLPQYEVPKYEHETQEVDDAYAQKTGSYASYYIAFDDIKCVIIFGTNTLCNICASSAFSKWNRGDAVAICKQHIAISICLLFNYLKV